jgi:hypothetical protein
LECRCVPSTVTNLADAGPGSLRDALATTPSGGTVDFQPGLSGTITLTSATLAITQDVTIAGPGADVITVSGSTVSLPRPFTIAPGVTVTIMGLTIANGNAGYGGTFFGGGAIYNGGFLTITACSLTGNRSLGAADAGPAGGGGIYNFGTLTVTWSMIAGNVATGGSASGGGIYNAGTLTLVDSTVSGNHADGHGLHNRGGSGSGGGIENTGILTIIASTLRDNDASGSFEAGRARGGGIANEGTLTLVESTLSNNNAFARVSAEGGGISNFGTVAVTSCTLSGNATGIGGGIADDTPGTVRLQNTILAGNSATASADVLGALNSLGHNLIGIGDGSSDYADTDLVGTSANPIAPLLGRLQDNGGPTPTMALLAGSPAIDAGALTDMEWDQRGPGYPRLVNGATDIGAFEVQDNTPAAYAIPISEAMIGVADIAPRQASVPMPARASTAPPAVPLSQTAAAVDQVFVMHSGEESRFLLPQLNHDKQAPADLSVLGIAGRPELLLV